MLTCLQHYILDNQDDIARVASRDSGKPRELVPSLPNPETPCWACPVATPRFDSADVGLPSFRLFGVSFRCTRIPVHASTAKAPPVSPRVGTWSISSLFFVLAAVFCVLWCWSDRHCCRRLLASTKHMRPTTMRVIHDPWKNGYAVLLVLVSSQPGCSTTMVAKPLAMACHPHSSLPSPRSVRPGSNAILPPFLLPCDLVFLPLKSGGLAPGRGDDHLREDSVYF